jgi:SAM-dependent methyltransferase
MPHVDDKSRPFGRYSDESWKTADETDGNYEWRRFQRTPEGQEKNRREQNMVRQFLLRLPRGSTVLDVPAGMGRFTESILEAGHRPVSIDLNFGRIADTRQRLAKPLPAMQGDILHLPLADQSVDAVLCFRLFHHLPAEIVGQVLRELRRVAPRAYVTFYSRHTLKFYKKHLRGKSVSGQYYPARQVIEQSRAAGWTTIRHETPFMFWRILHALDLQK